MNTKFTFPRRIPVKLLCFLLVLLQILTLMPSASAHSDTPDSDLINILLIGQDRREEDTTARSDSIILCSFQPEEKKITMTSFLRDLYVEIPGHESNRLNAAYALGGMPLLKETIQNNFEITIDGCITADFSCFPQIIDTLGGVTIELRQDEADIINKTISGELAAGLHLLNGDQALAYSRIRKLDADGDFSRTSRQRRLLTSLMDSYRNASLITMMSVVADLLPMVSTDLSKKEIIKLAARLFPLMESPSVVSQRIPADGTYSFGTVRNMDVLIADLEEARLQLKTAFESENESGTSVLIPETGIPD